MSDTGERGGTGKRGGTSPEAVAPMRTPRTSDEELLCAEHAITHNSFSDEQRVARMRAEMAEGFATLADVKRGVSLFGSARTPVEDPGYELASDTSTYGLNIQLPFEQRFNPYVDVS